MKANNQIAFIGLGNMGRGMCRNLVQKSLWTQNKADQTPLIVFNRSRSRAEDLRAELPHNSVLIANSIEDAVARSDIVFTCLSDDDTVRHVIDTALACKPSGKLFVECSTISPLETKALSARVLQGGARFVACPVFGAPDRADQGQLICVPAGPRRDVECVLPYCQNVMARAVIDLSDKAPEAATTLKVIGNAFIFNMVEAVAEGHVLAEKAGLGGPQLHEFLALFFPGVYERYSERMMSGDYWDREEPLFLAGLARKDAKHAMTLADAVGTKLPALEVADAHLARVEELKHEQGDYVGVYGILRQEAGLKYENVPNSSREH